MNRTYYLAAKPDGALTTNHFEMREEADPVPGEGQVLLRTILMSIDAANRAWMDAKTYRPQVMPGDAMPTLSISEVIESRDPSLAVGDVVIGESVWTDRYVAPAKFLNKAPEHRPLSQLHSILGIAGLTAHHGLMQVGQPQEGETVVVSAAAGSVGSLVGQIAKIKGCRAVGIAGNDEKGKWLTEELGFDAFVNYKADDFTKQLRAACPGGIDVYFDNVGGPVMEAVLKGMNINGRVVCCGAVSSYNNTGDVQPTGIPGILVVKRLTMRGFIAMDFPGKNAAAVADLVAWAGSGKLNAAEDIVNGLENAPSALVGLLNGENRGKRMVRVGPDPV